MLCDISNVAVLHRFTTTFPTTSSSKDRITFFFLASNRINIISFKFPIGICMYATIYKHSVYPAQY